MLSSGGENILHQQVIPVRMQTMDQGKRVFALIKILTKAFLIGILSIRALLAKCHVMHGEMSWHCLTYIRWHEILVIVTYLKVAAQKIHKPVGPDNHAFAYMGWCLCHQELKRQSKKCTSFYLLTCVSLRIRKHKGKLGRFSLSPIICIYCSTDGHSALWVQCNSIAWPSKIVIIFLVADFAQFISDMFWILEIASTMA